MGELNIYGVYVPTLLIQSVFAYGLLRLVMLGTDPLIEKGWIPLPSIFYLCLYVKNHASRQAFYDDRRG